MKHVTSRLLLAALCVAPALAAPALAQEFPLTIETRFGTTVIPEQPERVATVDYAGADNVLALGFEPLTARAWFGPYDNALWPWAEALATVDPQVLDGDLNFEQIAATEPDIILALRSGITQADYDKLSLIAPVVAVPPGRGDYDLDWEEQAELTGLALGKSEEAAAQIEGVKASLAAVAEAHPEWQGKTFAMMTYWNGSVGLYSATDSSVAFMSALGLVPHPKVVELSTPGEFYIGISEEILPELDADVVVWYAAPDSPEIAGLVARQAMRAPAEGREIFLSLDSLANGAMSHGSLLSLPEAAERLTPMIAAAIDGDPATEVPLD
ncbi:ABC transporter substrate-binding protein [Pelagibacterium halotolerans]|uniref:ABC transporter substrate-binding protein n=1 Tax=Pelagibacterium halotolerans TaxID=531813 RepID=UPI00384E8177